MAPRTVLLCGASLLLSGVAACLAESADQYILRANSLHEAGPLVAQAVPDVIICDLADASQATVLQLLVEHPQLVLLGLDMERNRGVLLSAQEAHALTVHDIQELVRHSDLR
jgi:hypothetical protein